MALARSHPPTEAELAGLADGSLQGRRRVQVEASVAASPDLQAVVEEQRRAVRAIRSEREPAPSSLRTAVSDPARAPARAAAPRLSRIAAAVGVACLAVIALAVVLLAVGSNPPTLAQAAELGTRPAEGLGASPSGPMGATAAGDPYRDWERRYGWRVVGARRDHLAGHPATTIFYERYGKRLAYTVVSGRPLPPPVGASATVRDGVRFASFRSRGRVVVTWLHEQDSCLLSARGVHPQALASLAVSAFPH